MKRPLHKVLSKIKLGAAPRSVIVADIKSANTSMEIVLGCQHFPSDTIAPLSKHVRLPRNNPACSVRASSIRVEAKRSNQMGITETSSTKFPLVCRNLKGCIARIIQGIGLGESSQLTMEDPRNASTIKPSIGSSHPYVHRRWLLAINISRF